MPDDQYIKIHPPFVNLPCVQILVPKVDQFASDISAHTSCRLTKYKQTVNSGAAMTDQLPKLFQMFQLFSRVNLRTSVFLICTLFRPQIEADDYTDYKPSGGAGLEHAGAHNFVAADH
jgi:hypothetical protein